MNKNTYADSKGNSTKSTGYEVIKIDMTNVAGEVKDIKAMVGYIKIYENIFSPTLVLELGIRDESNFFEEFGITGNEIIELEILTKALDVEQTISHTFFVTKYHDFGKGKDLQVQVYTLTAVSEFAYVAPLKTISRAVSGDSINTVKNIFKNDLNQKVIVKGNSSSSYDGIITINNPLSAALDILDKSFDDNNTPYMLFQQLNGNVYVTPLSYLTNFDENPVYKTIQNKNESEANPDTPEEYLEKSTMMTEVTSNINISPSYSATEGVFASENRYIDIGLKTYRKHIFNSANHLKAKNTLSKKINNEKSQEVSNRRSSETSSPFEKIPGAKINYNYVNKFSFDGFNSISALAEKNKHLSEAYLANFDICTHKFKLFGDPLLNPGRVLELLFPKATDPGQLKEHFDSSVTEVFDKRLSGNYLIFKTMHYFYNSEYTTECVVKTDSLKEEESLGQASRKRRTR